MKDRSWLYFAIGFLVAVGIGAATPQLDALPSTLTLRDDGIVFPDGSLQTTAAGNVADLARAGFNERCFISVPDGDVGVLCDFNSVPSGRILVVEFVSAYLQAATGQKVQVLIEIGDGTGWYQEFHPLPVQLSGNNGSGDLYEGSQSLLLYLDQTQVPAVQVVRLSASSDQLSGWVSLSGYYVDR